MRNIVFFLLLSLSACLFAKTTYIPKYRGLLSITKDGETSMKFDSLREVSLGYDNGHVTFTILHEEVTRSKVKSIKRTKMGAGWASVGWGLAMGFSQTDGQYMVNYLEAKEDMKERGEQIENVQTLHIALLIENNTDQTIFVSDMAKGTSSWYIAPRGYITLELVNPSSTQYRVSNVYVMDPKTPEIEQETAYVTVEANSSVKKESIDFEDDDCWIFVERDLRVNATEENNWGIVSISRLDKETFKWTNITYDELEYLKFLKKDAEKREKQLKKAQANP